MVKETLGDKLRREAAERQQEAARKRREQEMAALKRQREEAEILWNEEILPTLVKDIRKAAKDGRQSFQVPDLVYMNAYYWARENGMHVHESHDSNDIEMPMHFPPTICWAEHPRAW